MPSQENCTESWLLPFYWCMGLAMTSAHGFPFSRSVTFITTKTGLWLARITRPIQWTVLPLVALPHLMCFWSTTRGQSNIMNWTPTVLIPIDCLPWFIHLSNMTVVSSVHYIGTTTQAWKNYTLRARASNDLTHQPICSWRERSWISPFTPI